ATFLPFGVPSFGEEERQALLGVLDSRWIGQGSLCEEFEQRLARYVGTQHGVFVNSATAGLHLSLMALGVGAGDEVITTPLTFVATVNVIEHCGAKPVLADIDPVTLNIDPAAIARCVSPRTKAVIGVHFAGRPFDIDGVRRAAGTGVPIVEDAAHAIGGRFSGGKMVGASGNLTVFSFYANKNLTTGEGGMIVTDDADIAERTSIMRLHGLSSDAWKRFTSKKLNRSLAILPGYKYNSTDLNAALGIAQLGRIEDFLTRREAIAAAYDRELADVAEIELVERPNRNGERHALHLYIVKLRLDRLTVDRNEIVGALREENIGAGIHYDAVHLHPFYRETYGWRSGDFPIAADVSSSVLTLPGQPSMTDDDVASVVLGLKRVVTHYRR
ncbi:MAG TPA: DegT/DnrJ/EryC1/StrS family aminotransferase, partial [Candidatus Baltobacteraceae bacterium]|nr:DegT/DnrJ/EryC1/StrS family aminotransferase [Candidatus Baltobacteraceae bacterium]